MSALSRGRLAGRMRPQGGQTRSLPLDLGGRDGRVLAPGGPPGGGGGGGGGPPPKPGMGGGGGGIVRN